MKNKTLKVAKKALDTGDRPESVWNILRPELSREEIRDYAVDVLGMSPPPRKSTDIFEFMFQTASTDAEWYANAVLKMYEVFLQNPHDLINWLS